MAKFAIGGVVCEAVFASFSFRHCRLGQLYVAPLYYLLICTISTSIIQSNANFAQ